METEIKSIDGRTVCDQTARNSINGLQTITDELNTAINERYDNVVLNGNIIEFYANGILKKSLTLPTSSDVPVITYGEIVISKTTSTIIKGKNDTFTVSLNKQPTNNQVVSLSSSTTDITLDKTELTFTIDDWNIAQTVTVSVIAGATNTNGTITLSSDNVVSKTITININEVGQDISVTGVSFDDSFPSSLKEDETLQLTPVIEPSNATNQNVVWATSDDSIATVQNGLVTAVSEGDCQITATTEDGDFVATCWLGVSPKNIVANTMPALYLTGDFDKLTSSASEITLDSVIFKSIDGEEVFRKKGLCAWQGNTSIQFPEKNYSLDLLELDGSTSYKYKLFDDVNKNDSYHLKANYVDISHARNISVVSILKDWRITELPTGARGCVNGKPILLYINGIKHGVYTFNLKQHGKTVYGMDKTNVDHLLYRAESNVGGLTTSFRALSTDNTEAGAKNKDWEDRFPKTATDENRAKLNRVIQWVMDCENNTTKFKDEIDSYFNKDYLIDYYIACNLFLMTDSLAKNMCLATYDGNIWYLLPYDCDGSLGNKWNGTQFTYNTDLDDVAECKDSLLWELLKVSFDEEIKTRYKELRRTKLTKNNIVNTIKIITDNIPASEYEFDKTAWPDKPGQDSGIDYMTTWIDNRIAYMDTVYGYSPLATEVITSGMHTWLDLTDSVLNENNTVLGKNGYGVMTLNNFTHDNSTNGFINGGLEFDGVNTYAILPVTFNNEALTYTIAFEKTDAEASKWNAITSSGKYSVNTDQNTQSFYIQASPTRLQIYSDNREWSDKTSEEGTTDFVNNLCIITITKNKTTGKTSVYINDRLAESERASTMMDYISPLYIGGRLTLVGSDDIIDNYAKMNLKHVLLYDRELSMSEVMNNHIAIRYITTGQSDAVSSVTLDKHTIDFNVGETSVLNATILPTTALNKGVTWSCDNTNCSITDNGLTATIKGEVEGQSVITVKTEEGDFTDTCNVTINSSNDKTIATTSYTTQGNVTEISDGVYKLVNSSSYDKIGLCGDTTAVPAGDYNICIKVIDRSVDGIDGTTAKLQYLSTYAITSKTTLETDLLTCDLNTIYKQQVTVKDHILTDNKALISCVQFNNSGTGDYITVKLWLESI